MIKNLQALRGIAALMIFAHHFGFNSAITESFGDCAVALFMMLSGFVLTFSVVSSQRKGRPLPLFSRFITKRLARIYPLYLIAQVCTFVLLKFDIGITNALTDILMIQSWIPSPDFYFSGNAPSWFVSDLFFCYLIFLPAFKLFIADLRKAAVMLSCLLATYLITILLLPDTLVHPIIYIFPPMQFPVFAIGMLGAILILKSPPYADSSTHKVQNSINTDASPLTSDTRIQTRIAQNHLNRADVWLFAPVLLMVVQIFAYPAVPVKLSLSSYWWVASLSLIYLFSYYDKTKCLVSSVLHTRPMIIFGDISYSFYIFHLPFLYAWNGILEALNIPLPIGLSFVLSAILLFGLSYLLHTLIEIPLTKRLDTL